MIHVFRFLITFILLALSIPIVLGSWIAALLFWERQYFEDGSSVIENIMENKL